MFVLNAANSFPTYSISVPSPLFLIIDKLLLHQHIYPAISHLSSVIELSDQFAFRLTASTTAAVISIIDKVTTMLMTEPYVHVIALDFSHAFDVVPHSTLFDSWLYFYFQTLCLIGWSISIHADLIASNLNHLLRCSCPLSVISTPVWFKAQPWVLYLSSPIRLIYRSPRLAMLCSSMLTIYA